MHPGSNVGRRSKGSRLSKLLRAHLRIAKRFLPQKMGNTLSAQLPQIPVVFQTVTLNKGKNIGAFTGTFVPSTRVSQCKLCSRQPPHQLGFLVHPALCRTKRGAPMTFSSLKSACGSPTVRSRLPSQPDWQSLWSGSHDASSLRIRSRLINGLGSDSLSTFQFSTA